MKSVLDNLIEIVGISDMLPIHSKYFKQFQVQEYFEIPCQKPDMEQILRITVKAEIIETKFIETPEGESFEGQILGGWKLQVRGKLLQKIEYVADEPLQSVHAAESEVLFSNYIVFDRDVDPDIPISVTPYIEDIYVKQINNREIFKNIMLLINAVSPMINPGNCRPEFCGEDSMAQRLKKSKNCPVKHKEKKYFTQFTAVEYIRVPSLKPDIEQIVSAIADPEIISLKVINTIKGLSAEGQCLSGKKIVVEIKIKQKILYAADVKVQSIHGVENEFYQSIYVVVPEQLEGTDIETLLKNKLLQPKIKVEDIYVMPIDKRKIFKNITLLLEFIYVPTYEICYSSHNNCTSSNLYIMYEDGNRNTKITYDEEKKNVKPAWSPDGQYIAYLIEEKGKSSLYILNLKNMTKAQLTSPDEFDLIGSFCWSTDGRKIVFSASRDGVRGIFSIDVNSRRWKQLINSSGVVKSYKPKCSPDGNKIAYLSSVSDVSNLWIADLNGFNSRQLTDYGFIKDFDWKEDSKKIVCIAGKVTTNDELFTIDIDSLETKPLLECDNIHEKKFIRISPDGRYAVFIGTKHGKDCHSGVNDIYVYEFCSKALVNITNNFYKVNISEFVWKIDSNKVYYASDELGYYNVYSIDLNDLTKRQLTNSNASNMQLSYRPRVK